jgi:selenide,water dikinase
MTRRLVLVGAGHAHLHVLRRWAKRPLPDVELVLIAPSGEQYYSGMVPGYLQTRFDVSEMRIDTMALARCAGARFVRETATAVRSAEGLVRTTGEEVPFDLCSIDVGSGVAGGDLPGVKEHTIPLRPMSRAITLRTRIDAVADQAGAPLSIAVVGGGAGGIEVAFALQRRITESARGGVVTVVDDALQILPDETAGLRTRTHELLRARGVCFALGAQVKEVRASTLLLESGATLSADFVVWTTGSAPPLLLRSSDLPLDDEGFLRVDKKLRAIGVPTVLGAGDCVSLPGERATRSGVRAARQGPVLLNNLRAALGRGQVDGYQQRGTTLAFIDTADGRALARFGRLHLHNGLAAKLKDGLDRRFVRRLRATCDETPVAAG